MGSFSGDDVILIVVIVFSGAISMTFIKDAINASADTRRPVLRKLAISLALFVVSFVAFLFLK